MVVNGVMLGVMVALGSMIIVLIINSVMLGRWAGRLTEKVSNSAKDIVKLNDTTDKHEERLRMVENAVIRFEEAVTKRIK